MTQLIASKYYKFIQTTLAQESGLSRMTVVRTELEQFIQSGDKYVRQAPRMDTPLSVIDTLLGKGPKCVCLFDSYACIYIDPIRTAS